MPYEKIKNKYNNNVQKKRKERKEKVILKKIQVKDLHQLNLSGTQSKVSYAIKESCPMIMLLLKLWIILL